MEKVVGALINVVSLFSMPTALHWVHRLFSTPRKGKLNAKALPAFLRQADLGFFWYKKNKVYYYQWKSTQTELPLVLLIHGWESNSARWEALCTTLEGQFRFVAVDAPSLGQSNGKNLSVKNYQEVIDIALQTFQPQFVIGHSLGAFALFQQLSETTYPGLKKAVILGAFDRFEVILSHYYHLLGYSKRVKDAYHTYIEHLINKPISTYCSADAVPFVDVEVLCIHDREDPQVSFEEAQRFHQALQRKNNEVLATENLGHSLQDETVFHTIQTFLR
ncbi:MULTISPECIES: alpha/beta hydrolase [unclassified Myroides]|uniref:alpha/beta hydrolase n=1 Tax=unclassified Myroides TaxID=2642485 RepID=UPI003D2F606A